MEQIFSGTVKVVAHTHIGKLDCMQVIEKTGAPGEIRTPNPQIRSLVLCPIELRARSE